MMERQKLFDALSDAMRGVALEGTLDWRFQSGRVRSCLLEAHCSEGAGEGVEHLLRQISQDADLSMRRVGDDLWALIDADDAFFVDALNPRFWLLHSTAGAGRLRRLLGRHFLATDRLDRAWLSSEILQQLEGKRHRAALTAVSSRLDEPGMGWADVAADYQGSFVASGTDFHLVAGMLWRTLDRYEAHVRGLEDAYRLGVTATKQGGLSIEGEVAMIEFPHEVKDLQALVANLFTCREPFRLWAVPREVAADQWEANAVDLHVGHPITLEITPRWLRVLLGPHTCGNTLARLVANLQHRFDARTVLAPPVAV